MQAHILVVLLLSVAFTEGLIFGSSSKCPIKKYKSGKYITGNDLLLHQDVLERVKYLEALAKDCRVHVYVKGSYYQLGNPSQYIPVSDYDLVIGHAFQFELRNENNAVLCNKICLSNNPMNVPEARCFLQGAINRGLTWSRYYPELLSDGTAAANTYDYPKLKADIQTRCRDAKLKRQLLRTLRKVYDEEEKKKK